MTGFSARLEAAILRRGTPALVGLDPRFESLPAALRSGRDAASCHDRAAAYEAFCCGVIDAVAPLVAAVKPQAAFFEQLGPAGMKCLAQTISYARRHGLLVILDAKRNDIGSTAAAYAEGYLGPSSVWQADALTVSPYLGGDSLAPFVETAVAREAGIFVLVKTSNPGAGHFQDLVAAGRPLYAHVAAYIEQLASDSRAPSGFGAVGAVVGATYPAQLAELRQAMPHAWLLVPGMGTQGAAAEDVAAAFDPRGLGALINNSRGIIFAHTRPEFRDQFGDKRWQDAIAAATREMIEQLASCTHAGRLRDPHA